MVVECARGRLGRNLVLVGALLFAVAWFVPVHHGLTVLYLRDHDPSQLAESWTEMFESVQTRHGKPPTALHGPSWLPGWHACEIAWSVLEREASQPQFSWQSWLAGSSCFTNVLMVMGLLMLLRRKRPRLVGLLLLVCLVPATSWLWLMRGDRMSPGWGPGYFLWLASFLLVGIGAELLPAYRSDAAAP